MRIKINRPCPTGLVRRPTNRHVPRALRACVTIHQPCSAHSQWGGENPPLGWIRGTKSRCLQGPPWCSSGSDFSFQGVGLILGLGGKITRASQPKSQNVKQKQCCNGFHRDFKKKKRPTCKTSRQWTSAQKHCLLIDSPTQPTDRAVGYLYEDCLFLCAGDLYLYVKELNSTD